MAPFLFIQKIVILIVYTECIPNPQTVIERPALYVVATPIGNLRDITLRALDVLSGVDVVFCEDTRVSVKLLRNYLIKTPMQTYHDHNGEVIRPRIQTMLEEGKAVALISDAGTPLISDPGYKLVREVQAAGFAVIPIPGASSILSALMGGGVPTDHFMFHGFLPPKQGKRQHVLKELKAIPATLVIMEAPHRLRETLKDMQVVFGGKREVVVTRELTKRFEEFRRDTLQSLNDHYDAHGDPKGEIVILVSPETEKVTLSLDDEEVISALRDAMGEYRTKEAAQRVAQEFGFSKQDVYAQALKIKEAGE